MFRNRDLRKFRDPHFGQVLKLNLRQAGKVVLIG